MTREKKDKIRNKNDLPVLDSDEDFLNVFEQKEKLQNSAAKKNNITTEDIKRKQDGNNGNDSQEHENFEAMLEESFNSQKRKFVKKSKPVTLKQRLKRYPGVECELDLHGYNAMGAQLKLRSFIHSSKYQGFFTIRVIVGRGLHSENGAVLPDVVEDELEEMKKQNFVIFYEWDRKKKSKSGAIIVYLKQFEQYD
jgi:DNA-nicking Smr family endonuclease